MADENASPQGAAKYASNVAKSFLKIAPSIARGLMPNAHSLYTSVVTSDGRQVVKDMTTQMKTVLKEDVGRTLRDTGRNIKEAIKSGHLFSPGSAKGKYGDLFLEGLEESLPDVQSMLADAVGDDVAEAKLPEVMAAAVGGASAAAALASSPAFKAGAAASIESARTGRLQVAATQAMGQAIVSAVLTGNNYLDNIQRFQNTQTRVFYDNVITQGKEKIGVLREISMRVAQMAAAQTANIAASDAVSSMMAGRHGTSSVFNSIMDSRGGIRVNNYVDLLRRRISDFHEFGFLGMLVTEGTENPIGTIAGQLVQALVPKEFKANLARFDQFLEQLGAAALERTGALAKKLTNSDNPLLQFLGGLVDKFSIETTGSQPQFGAGAGPRQVYFDGYTHRAINEVIPTYLSMIHAETAAIRGHLGAKPPGDRAIYDPQRGVFASAKATIQATDNANRARALEAYEPLRREGGIYGQDASLDAALEALSNDGEFRVGKGDTADEIRAKLSSVLKRMPKQGGAGGKRLLGLDYNNPLIRGALGKGQWGGRHRLVGGRQMAIDEHDGMNASRLALNTEYAGYGKGAGVGIGDIANTAKRVEAAQGSGAVTLGALDEGSLASDKESPSDLKGMLKNPLLIVAKTMRKFERTLNRWFYGGDADQEGLLGNTMKKAGGAVLRMFGVKQGEIDEKGVMGVVRERVAKATKAFIVGLIGEKGEDGIRRGGLFSGVMNSGSKWLNGDDGKGGVLGSIKGSLSEKIFKPLKDALIGPDGTLTAIKKNFVESFWGPTRDMLAGEDGIWTKIKTSFGEMWGDMRKALFGESKGDSRRPGGVALGAIVGGLFGGPLGAAVGAGAGSMLPQAMDWMSAKIEKSMEPMKKAVEAGAEWVRQRVIEPFSKFMNDPEKGIIPRLSRSLGEGMKRFLEGDGESPGFIKRVVEPTAKFVRTEIMDPVRKAMHEMWDSSIQFFKDQVIGPLKGTLEPFTREFKHQMGKLWGFTKELAGELDNTIKGAFGKSLSEMLKEKVVDPIKGALSWARGILGKVLSAAIKFPVSIIKGASDKLRASQIKRGIRKDGEDPEAFDVVIPQHIADRATGAGGAGSAAAAAAAAQAETAAKAAPSVTVPGMPGGGGDSPATSGDVGILKKGVDKVEDLLKEGLKVARGETGGKGKKTPAAEQADSTGKIKDASEKTLSFLRDNMSGTTEWLERIYQQLRGDSPDSIATGNMPGGGGGGGGKGGWLKRIYTGLIKNPIKAIGELASTVISSAIDPIKQTILAGVELIKGPFKAVAAIVAGFGKVIMSMKDGILGSMEILAKGLGHTIGLIKDASLGVVEVVGKATGQLASAVGEMVGGILKAMGPVTKFLGGIVSGIGGLLGGALRAGGGLFGGAMKAIGGVAGGLYEAGGGLVGGMVNSLGLGGKRAPEIQPVFIVGGAMASEGGASTLAEAKMSAGAFGAVKKGLGKAGDAIKGGWARLRTGWSSIAGSREEQEAEEKKGGLTSRLIKATEGSAKTLGSMNKGFGRFWSSMLLILPAIGTALTTLAEVIGLKAVAGGVGSLFGLGGGAAAGAAGGAATGVLGRAAGMLGKGMKVGGGLLKGGLLTALGGMAADYGVDHLMGEGGGKDAAKAAIRVGKWAGYGATAGSVVPVLGTGVGAVVGGAGGMIANAPDFYHAWQRSSAQRAADERDKGGRAQAKMSTQMPESTMAVPTTGEATTPTTAYTEAGGKKLSSTAGERAEELMARMVSALETIRENTTPEALLDTLKKAAEANAPDKDEMAVNAIVSSGISDSLKRVVGRKSSTAPPPARGGGANGTY